MIYTDTPIIRAQFADATVAASPANQEGKFGSLNESGQITIATAANASTLGVITDPNSNSAAFTGSKTEASLVLYSYPGIVGVQLAASPGTIAPGTQLALTSTGALKARAAAGDTIVAIAMESVSSTSAGQIIKAILVKPYASA